MIEMLVDCPAHGIVSVESNSQVTGGGALIIGGSTTRCPRCGRIAAIIDSTFQSLLDGSILTTLRPTPAQLLRLQSAVAWAQEAMSVPGVDASDVGRKLRRTVDVNTPGLAPMVDKILSSKSGSLGTWVSVVIALIALISSQQTLSPEDVVRIVQHVQEQDESTHPEPVPTETAKAK